MLNPEVTVDLLKECQTFTKNLFIKHIFLTIHSNTKVRTYMHLM